MADTKDLDLIRATATRRLKLKPKWKDDSLVVIVTLGWSVREDDLFTNDENLLDDVATLKELPPGFSQIASSVGTFRCEGTLTKNFLDFKIISNLYNHEWSVRPYAVVEQKS